MNVVPPYSWRRAIGPRKQLVSGQEIAEFKAEIVVEEAVLLELKFARVFESAHPAQLLDGHQFTETELKIALLFNFRSPPQFRPGVFANARKKIRGEPREAAARILA
jgi:hypothetical protein